MEKFVIFDMAGQGGDSMMQDSPAVHKQELHSSVYMYQYPM